MKHLYDLGNGYFINAYTLLGRTSVKHSKKADKDVFYLCIDNEYQRVFPWEKLPEATIVKVYDDEECADLEHERI